MHRQPLTREQYDQIRLELDARARALLAADNIPTCVGCGAPYDSVTEGCSNCWDRKRRRERREDPVLHARDLEIWRNARRRRAARDRGIAA